MRRLVLTYYLKLRVEIDTAAVKELQKLSFENFTYFLFSICVKNFMFDQIPFDSPFTIIHIKKNKNV